MLDLLPSSEAVSGRLVLPGDVLVVTFEASLIVRLVAPANIIDVFAAGHMGMDIRLHAFRVPKTAGSRVFGYYMARLLRHVRSDSTRGAPEPNGL
jgi:hypothetical protein